MGLPTKSPFKSFGAISSFTSIASTMFAIVQWYTANQDLIAETQTQIIALYVALAGGIGALIGRWRARLPLSLKGEKIPE